MLIGGRTFRRTHELSLFRYAQTEYRNVPVCQTSAANVVTIMKTPGMRENFVGARVRARWIVMSMIARPARS